MSNIWADLASVRWWFSVVIAGFIVNILAAYAKPRIDSLGGRLSKRWAERSEAAKMRREARIAALVRDPHQQLLQTLEAHRLRLEAAEAGVIAAILTVVGISASTPRAQAGWYAIAAFLMLKALASRMDSYSTDLEAHEASQRTQAVSGSSNPVT